MATRADWLLLFIEVPGGPYPSDQVRVMKGMFLLDQIVGHPVRGLYHFDAYDYGPFDSNVYRDLSELQVAGLIDIHQFSGSARRTYELTGAGSEHLRVVLQRLDEIDVSAVASVKKRVTSLGFDDLLSEIYDQFPDYATLSNARLVAKR